MKRFRLTLCFLLTALMVIGMVSFRHQIPAAAAEKEAYTYTVRVYAGAQGTFTNGQEVMVYEGIKPGTRFSFDTSLVSVNNPDKYFIIGTRISGRDNEEIAPNFDVDRDIDLVVGYGIFGNKTSYTVTYRDANGVNLAPAQTGYANAGTRFVVGAIEIEGYEVQNAYNLARTLSTNASQNTFDFIYRPVEVVEPTSEESSTTTPEGTTPGGTTPEGTTPGTESSAAAGGEGTESSGAAGGEGTESQGAGGEGTESQGAGGEGSEGAGGQGGEGSEGAGGQGGEGSGAQGQESSGPAEIIELDDSSVPMAGPEESSGSEGQGSTQGGGFVNFLKSPAGIVSEVVVVAGLGFGIWGIIAALRGKKKDE